MSTIWQHPATPSPSSSTITIEPDAPIIARTWPAPIRSPATRSASLVQPARLGSPR